MGRRNNKETVSTPNHMITDVNITEILRASEEKIITEIQRAIEEKITKSMTEMNENLQKKLTEIEKKLNESMVETKASIQTIKNRLEHMEGRTSLLEDDRSKIEHTINKLEKKIQQHEADMEEIWAQFKRANLRIIGIEEGREVETNGINNIFKEVVSENFPNIEKEINTQIQETYRTPPRQDQRRGSSRHIIVKLTNEEAKERILKAAKAKPK